MASAVSAAPVAGEICMREVEDLLRIVPDPPTLARLAADLVVTSATEALAKRHAFHWVLAGGETPRLAYELLAEPAQARRIDWSLTQVYWTDERCVSPDDPRSNYRMAREALLAHVPIPPGHVHRIRGELGPEAAAEAYENGLRRGWTHPPEFDLVLLGLGSDGHTASLFPRSEALSEAERWACGVRVASQPEARVTLTPMALSGGRVVAFLVAGAAKAPALEGTLAATGREPSPDWPATSIRPASRRVHWLLDRSAAARVAGRP
jgi:6-phosphogluconolactonase